MHSLCIYLWYACQKSQFARSSHKTSSKGNCVHSTHVHHHFLSRLSYSWRIHIPFQMNLVPLLHHHLACRLVVWSYHYQVLHIPTSNWADHLASAETARSINGLYHRVNIYNLIAILVAPLLTLGHQLSHMNNFCLSRHCHTGAMTSRWKSCKFAVNSL